MPFTKEVVWDVDSPSARMQLGSGSGPGCGGSEFLEAGLGNARSAGEVVCSFGFVYLVNCFCLFVLSHF